MGVSVRLTLAFWSTFPLLAMMDRGRFFRAVAELTGDVSPLLVGAAGAGAEAGAGEGGGAALDWREEEREGSQSQTHLQNTHPPVQLCIQTIPCPVYNHPFQA